MRLAILVHAPTFPTALRDVAELTPRLTRPEMGFSVLDVAARDDAALGLPRALEGTPGGSTALVVLMAEVRRAPLGVLEIVGATRGVRFDEIRAALGTAGLGEALLVIDGVYPSTDSAAATETASIITRVLSPAASGVGALVALREARPASEGEISPLVRAIGAAIDQASGPGGSGVLTAAGLHEALAQDESLGGALTVLRFVPGGRDAQLVRPPPLPFSAPAPMAAFAEANTLLAQGKLDEALDACKRVLLLGEDRDTRAEVYVRIAVIKQRQGKIREATFNLDKALVIDPLHRTALEGHIMVAASEQRWADLSALGDRLLTAIEAPEDRLRATLDLARVMSDQAHDEERAVALLERARVMAPRSGEVLERLVPAYDRARRFDALVGALEDYAAITENAYQRAARLGAAARVASRGLGDKPRAIRLLDQALRGRRDDPDLYADLADLLEQMGQDAPALRAAQLGAAQGPRRADFYRLIGRAAARLGRADLAVQAATVLGRLGEADLDDELLADQHRPEGPLAARQPLPAAAWERAIAPAGAPGVMAVFEAIDEAVIGARVGDLQAAGKLTALDPKTRQDPQTSTVTAVRAFGFAGRLLGVPLPELHILPEVAGGVSAVIADRPTTAIGRAVLSGRSAPELAFLMARHLAYHRPGARLVLFYPSIEELSLIFLAAVQLARPEAAISSRNAEALGRYCLAIGSRLDEGARARLHAAVSEVEASGQRPDLLLWQRRLELTATRAGLLACGDLEAASQLVTHDPAPIGDLSADARLDDLCAFAVSDAYGALRRELGVAIGE
jgi:tetratricopeptide (TPR) repeat protein